jgi:hypothetical protein
MPTSKNVDQIYISNPSTTLGSNDLLYVGKSPYSTNDDSAIKYDDLKNQLQSNILVDASQVNVLFTPSNYNPTSSNVEGNLEGIDAQFALIPQGVSWRRVNLAGTITLGNNNALIACTFGTTTFKLPATAAIGDTFKVFGGSAPGWSIAQNAGQIIHVGSFSTTTGVTGSISSTNQYDSLTISCINTDNEFTAYSLQGLPNIV